MNFLEQLINNHVLLASGLSWLISQIFKVIINLVVEKRIVWERFFGDGGMIQPDTVHHQIGHQP